MIGYTYRIDKNTIAGLPVLADGYKIFNEDWTCRGYCYADENGTAVGTVHKIDGSIQICEKGFHFCEELQNCIDYYPPVLSNKLAKVRAYGDIEKGEFKSCCSILEIVEEIDWDSVRLAGKDNVDTSSDVMGGYNVKYSSGVYGGEHVYNSVIISGGSNIYNSGHIHGGTEIIKSRGVTGADNVTNSVGVFGSRYIDDSFEIHGCRDVCGSCNVFGGYDICYSKFIYGCSDIRFSANLEGACHCIFCVNLQGTKYRIFNQKVKKEYFDKVSREIYDIIFKARYTTIATNYVELYNKYGRNIPIDKLQYQPFYYSNMPDKLLDYIKNLPEYDEKIFNKIINYKIREVDSNEQ